MTFTKEEQIQAIYDLKVGYTLGHSDIAILKSMARQLLAGMEQEPVADVVAWSSPNEERTCDIRWRRNDVKPGPLYTAPPVLVVQDEVRDAINRLLDSDGSRGTFNAVRSYDAREELERLLSAARQEEDPQIKK